MCRRCIAGEFDLDACICVLAVFCGVHGECQRLPSDEARAAFEHRALDKLVASVGGPDAIASILSKHGMDEVVSRRLRASFSVACYALLRMRPLSRSWAECSVAISCGLVDYEKSG
jgi:hypothetical protein